MYKKIRKSVAQAIATVDDPDQFEWNKWLKEPQIYLERFPKLRINVKRIENFSAFEAPTLYQVKKFTLTKFKVSEQIRSVILEKKKTFKIFFSFPKIHQQKITIFNPDAIRILYLLSYFYNNKDFFVRTKKDNKEDTTCLTPQCISKKVDPIKVTVKKFQPDLQKTNPLKHDCLVTKPDVLDYEIKLPSTLSPDKIRNLSVLRYNTKKKYLAIAFNPLEKKPKLKNIPVNTIEQIKEQLEKSGSKKILTIPIDELNQQPKQFRVKLNSLEKIQVPLFHLKNVHAKPPKLKSVKFNFLEKTTVNEKNLVKEYFPEIIIPDPGITSELITAEIEPQKKKPQKSKPKKEVSETKPKKVEENVIVEKSRINIEDVESNIKHLLPHQQEGIKLLLSNETALLSDELGIDKKIQAIHALHSAIKQGVIKKALIVCPNSNIGDQRLCQFVSSSDGWENQIYDLDPELRFATIRGKDYSTNENINEAQILITSYAALIDLSADSSSEHVYKNIDCLILDEAQYLVNNQIQSEELFNFPQSKYQWVLTSLPTQIIEEKLIPKLRNHLVGFEKLNASLNRTKQLLGNTVPSIVRNYFWHELDTEQAQEYENTLLQGRKRILDLVKGGNPFIIQSNIFTLIHQIKQLANFSTHSETSPKSNLLLDQLDSIIASGQKAIIFSQYDKQGIQKIEKLLKHNHIRYVLYQSGMPLKELENSANSFRKEPKINVMLAGLTAASVKVRIPEAAYLIHFDQWWNPITQWQYEDKTINTNDGVNSYESVNVLNYFGNNQVELNIRDTLHQKGLLTKNMIEFLNNETVYSLISNEDWLDILGIEHVRSYKNRKPDIEELTNTLSESSLENIGQLTKALFVKLGYKNLALKPDMLHEEITIYGTATKGLQEIKTAILCLPFKIKDAAQVDTFIIEASKNNSRLFVICSDDLLKNIPPDPQEKVTYIGQKSFASYISEFKVT